MKHIVTDLQAAIIQIQALVEENSELKKEIRVAREAADITAELVVRQFEKSEKLLCRFQNANAMRKAVLNSALQTSIIATDKDGIITIFNTGAENLLGYKAEEIIGKETPELFHSSTELIERSKEISKECGRTILPSNLLFEYAIQNRCEQQEWKYIQKNGDFFYVSMIINALRDSEGMINGFLCIAQDITECKMAQDALQRAHDELEMRVRKRTAQLAEANKELHQEIIERRQIEEALRISEEKYRGIFENAMEGIFQTTLDGKFISANPALAYSLGYDSAEELIADIKDIKNQLYVFPEQRDKLIGTMQEQKIIAGFEIQFFRKDRTKRWFSLNARSVRDNNGEMLFIEGMVEDITQRKQDEAALIQASEKRKELENIINCSPAVVFLWKNAPSLPVEFVSGNVSQFGYTADDFISGRVLYSEIIHPDDIIRVAKEIESHSGEKKGQFTQEYRILSKSGDVRWIDDRTWIRSNKKGDVTHYQGIIIDVTVKKEKEKAEREREIAEAANKKIMEGIQYASTIQKSLLPESEQVRKYLPNSFFIWEPRDIVSGDIFYVDSFKDGIIVAVIDCTGHGVPGAFMTMLASSAMRRIIRDESCHVPGEILKRLNYIIKTTLRQDLEFTVSDDGLDAAVCFISTKDEKYETNKEWQHLSPITSDPAPIYLLTFASARLPLYYVQNGDVMVIKGDRKSIGYKRSEFNFDFTNHTIRIDKETAFYMATDGFWGQFNENKVSFSKKRFGNLLKEIAHLPFDQQGKKLFCAFEEYRGNAERLDDVSVVGFGLVPDPIK